MVTFEEHINGILKQILESFHKLENLNDKPGGLEIIKIESLKINGFFKVIIKNWNHHKFIQIIMLNYQKE